MRCGYGIGVRSRLQFCPNLRQNWNFSKADMWWKLCICFLCCNLVTHTFIFIGCGFSDPDIQLVLENYSFVFPGSPCHYFITSKDGINTEYKRIVKENRNLEIITYDSKDNHRELHDALEELVPMVEDERTRIAKEMDW